MTPPQDQSAVARAVAIRRVQRKSKPRFKRQDWTKKKKLGTEWRKPKGLQSKMRQQLKHHPRVVKIGYKSPTLAHGLHRTGVRLNRIASVAEIAPLTAGDGVIIAKGTGIRTKLAIMEACAARNIPIMNIAVDKFKKRVADEAAQKQQEKTARAAKKAESKKQAQAAASKKTQESAKPEAAATEEEKKEQEKKAKDDVLIHKN
jgi:large subunit ribosomal protein L32e